MLQGAVYECGMHGIIHRTGKYWTSNANEHDFMKHIQSDNVHVFEENTNDNNNDNDNADGNADGNSSGNDDMNNNWQKKQ